MIDWQYQAQRLTDELARLGVRTDRRWRSALASVPRHRLVPAFYRQTPDLSGWYRIGEDDPATRDEWRDAVYTDVTLVTLLSERPGELGRYRVPISSSTRPSLMLAMLTELHVEDRMRVLEVGTGCGYNAAVLCARLGDSQVTSVDIDADLVSAARGRLAECGLHPTLQVADARNALPPLGPFDRLVATCAVERIPPSWLDVVVTAASSSLRCRLRWLTASSCASRGNGTARRAGASSRAMPHSWRPAPRTPLQPLPQVRHPPEAGHAARTWIRPCWLPISRSRSGLSSSCHRSLREGSE